MEELLSIFYIVLFVAILFFGPLQEFLHNKKAEWDLKKRSRRQKGGSSQDVSTPMDPEKTGFIMSIVLISLALAFFLWKVLTTSFAPF